MALVTLQRSPSPSNDPDEESGEAGEDGVDVHHALRHKSLSESYFTVKGAALILPHSEINRKTSRKNHGGEIQRHLQSMLYLLRPEDKIKVAIRLENLRETEHRYMALVSTTGRQDTEECVILGLDCTAMPDHAHSTAPTTPPVTPSNPPPSPNLSDTHGAAAAASSEHEGRGISMATIGLVLPIWMGMKVRLSGDGGFSIITEDHSYLFKPVSVQAMWSAIQSVDKALHGANSMKYLAEGLTHTWVEYYRSKMDNNQGRLATWNLMEDVEIFAPSSLKLTNENETEKLKLLISAKLKEVMMSVDLDEATSRSLRLQVEEGLNMKLDEFRNYFDEEMMRILGQMDAPSQILDFLYLGSEWNASNLDELQKLGIKYILNITREIDNFFTGMFTYCNVRIYDYEESELMKHWPKTYKFINKARKHGVKVLVHCKMGVSRSASTVIAYLMKENRWSMEKALAFVKERRSCVRPNKGFMEQLHTYEGILNASNQRDIFRSKSEPDLLTSMGSEEGESSQREAFLGESLFPMTSGCEWAPHSLTQEEDIELRKGCIGDHSYPTMEPDFETDSRSADSMEESLPDMPSPQDKDPPLPGLPISTQETAPSSEGRQTVVGGSPPRSDLGLPGRIKPDSSWIKLEMSGESSTDTAGHEGMEVTDTDSQAKSGDRKKECQASRPQSVSSPVTPPVIFVMGSEWDGEIAATPLKAGQDSCENQEQTPATGAGGEQAELKKEMGVHHYYSREQIPWNAGTVRNIREELCKSTQSSSKATTTEPAKFGKTSVDESEKVLLEAVGNVKEAHPVQPCESCVDFTALDTSGPEGMEMEDGLRSVYDLEDIPLTPGTVQRTRREIEQRQKLYGQECDQGLYGLRPIKRWSSLREKREGSRTRQSERRKTCTPIVSPPPEADTGSEEVEMQAETPVLKLNFEVEESSTDDVAMEEAKAEASMGDKEVAVYMFGQESVPVKKGIVQRHRREIESKWSDGHGGDQQRSLSAGSNGSVEEMDTCSHWTPNLPAVSSANEVLSDCACESAMLVRATYIPACIPPWQGSKPGEDAGRGQQDGIRHKPDSAASLKDGAWKSGQRADRDVGQECIVTASIWKGKDNAHLTVGDEGSAVSQQPHTDSRVRENTALSTPTSSKTQAFRTSSFPSRMRLSSESSEDSQDTPRMEHSFRPYSHSHPSAKKPYSRSNFDPETLAMIREIGSAFVTSPSRGDDEDNGGECTSLVKHLVKNIERETGSKKPERKIVLIDSSSSKQGRTETDSSRSSSSKQGWTETDSSRSSSSKQGRAEKSLFTPSLQFTVNIAKQLGSPDLLCPTPVSSSAMTHSAENLSKNSIASPAATPVSDRSQFLSPPSRPGGGDRSRSEPPSVVKHLCGRFESQGQLADSEGEHCPSGRENCSVSQLPHTASVSSSSSDACLVPVSLRDRGYSCCGGRAGLPKSASMEEPAASGSHVGMMDFTPQPPHTRRPGSAEPVPFSIAAQRVPWPTRERESCEDVEEGEEGCEGAKMRRLHGKSHPLSRLQGEKVYPPTIQHHSSFHSTM